MSKTNETVATNETVETNETVKKIVFGNTEFTILGECKPDELTDIEKNGLNESIFSDNEVISFPENVKPQKVLFKSSNLKSEKPYKAFLTNENKPISLGTINLNVGDKIMLVSEKLRPISNLTNIGTDKLEKLFSGKKFQIIKQKVFVQKYNQTDKKFETFVNPQDGQTYRTMQQKNVITLKAL